MSDMKVWLSVLLIALLTVLLRFLPFVLFSKSGKTPKAIERLGRTLPSAIMAMLVVYCLREINFENAAGFLPSLISCVVVVVCHIWKRNTLFSILSGTLCNMLLVQLFF